MENDIFFCGKFGSSYNIVLRVYHLQSAITDFMVKTALKIASVHAMAVITLMEGAITDASPVGKELIAAKVSSHIHIYHLFLSLRFENFSIIWRRYHYR